MDYVRTWWTKQAGNRQVVVFVLFTALLIAAFYFLGRHFAPAVVALVIAYVLDGPTQWLERIGFSRLWATVVTWLVSIFLLVLGLALLVPSVGGQVAQIGPNIGLAIDGMRPAFTGFFERNPWLLSPAIANEFYTNTSGLLDQILGRDGGLTRAFLQFSGVLSGAMNIVIYTVIVPLMTFFFLKDRDLILNACARYIPTESGLLEQVWRRTNVSISAYIRGKVFEVVLLGVVTYIVFFSLGSKWALTIAILTGLSPIIPIFGAVAAGIVTILLTFAEYLAAQEFGGPPLRSASGGGSLTLWFVVSCAIAYLVLQFIDGNLLQPLLFSEVVKLHPIAIFIAILVFGGMFGIWGLFFAIPAATLVRAILVSWPGQGDDLEADPSPEQTA